MKKKEKSVLCLIFLAAILYSGVTYIANGDTILGYYFDRHIWPWIIPFILCIVMPGVIGIINIVCIIKGAGAATIAGILSGIYYLLVICYDLFFRAWGHCLIFGSAGAEQCKIYCPVSGGMHHIGHCLRK